MSVSANDIYECASPLADAASEVEWRTGAVRVYYAAYHKSLEFVDLCPDLNSNFKMGSHERLSGRFKSHANMRAKAVAYTLEAMKKTRHMADYEIADNFPQSEALQQRAFYPVLEAKLVQFSGEVTSKVAP